MLPVERADHHKDKGTNLHLIKPQDPRGNLQEIHRKVELHPNYVINKIKTVGKLKRSNDPESCTEQEEKKIKSLKTSTLIQQVIHLLCVVFLYLCLRNRTKLSTAY